MTSEPADPFGALVVRFFLCLDATIRAGNSANAWDSIRMTLRSLSFQVAQPAINSSIYDGSVCLQTYPIRIMCCCGEVLGTGAPKLLTSCNVCKGNNPPLFRLYENLDYRYLQLPANNQAAEGNISPTYWEHAKVTALYMYIHGKLGD